MAHGPHALSAKLLRVSLRCFFKSVVVLLEQVLAKRKYSLLFGRFRTPIRGLFSRRGVPKKKQNGRVVLCTFCGGGAGFFAKNSRMSKITTLI